MQLVAIQGIIGIAGLIALAWAISENRRAFPWRTAAIGLVVQFALAALLIKLPGSQTVFVWIGNGVDALVRATEAGTSLVFGFLGGAPLPFEETYPWRVLRVRLPLPPAGGLHRRAVRRPVPLQGAALGRAEASPGR